MLISMLIILFLSFFPRREFCNFATLVDKDFWQHFGSFETIVVYKLK